MAAISDHIVIRPLAREDDAALARAIRSVLEEYQAVGHGYAHGDEKLDSMYANHSVPRSGYWVVLFNGRVVGGSGFGPTPGASDDVCELRRMYLTQEVRGRGLGRKLLEMTVESARSAGYRSCYLETLKRMVEAVRLYESFGFRAIPAPLNDTGCAKSDAWYLCKL